jgi:hypothetical protein
MAEPLQPVINTNTVAVDGDLATIGGGAPGSPRSTARCTTTGHDLASCSIDMPLAARTRTSRPRVGRRAVMASFPDRVTASTASVLITASLS